MIMINSDAIEAELGHVDTVEVRRAYHRALYWDERVAMADGVRDKSKADVHRPVE